jgi:hypothetical protein
MAQSGRKRIRLSGRAKIRKKGGKAAILHRLNQIVGHRQGKASPLHQPAEVTDFAHRQDSGREAARHGGFCLGQ